MNDTELDRLLDSWQAPAPPPSLRANLRARFRRAERRGFGRPLRWVLAIAVASAVLAVGMEQSPEKLADYRVVQILTGWYDAFMFGVRAHRIATMAIQVRDSDPRVFVDGSPAPPLSHHSFALDVQVPGDGVYSIVLGDMNLKGWTQTGRVDGSSIRFQAGTHRVVIECNQQLMISDAPVFVRKQ